jgi:hypothetical protein
MAYTEREAARRSVLAASTAITFCIAIILGMSLLWFRSDLCDLLGGTYQGAAPKGQCVGEWGGNGDGPA